MRALVLIAAFVVLSVLVACRTPERTGSPESSREEADPGRRVHDRTRIRVTARSEDGAVWGVGYGAEPGIFVWQGDAWRKTEDTRDWPGGVIAMMPHPADPAVVYSLWGGPPGSDHNVSVLHLWRHSRGLSSVRLASFPNPILTAPHTFIKTPRMSVDAAGDVWLTFEGVLLVRLAANGGTPEILEADRALFTPAWGKTVRGILPLSYLPEGPGRGWLWTVQAETQGDGKGELLRPARVAEGRIEACPPIAGLPDAGRVTFVSVFERGRMVWALEGRGL